MTKDEHAKMLREVDERVLPRRDWETDEEYGKRMWAYLNATEIHVKNNALGCPMTPHQYKTALERLGLTQDSAAQFLGVSLRTSHGYANSGPVPESVAKLLKLMIRLKLSPDEV